MATFGSPAATSGKPKSIAPHDCNIPQAGTDGISSLNWSPTANFLVSSNWDGGVRVWEVQANPANVSQPVQAQPKAQVNHDNKMPVLDTCFSNDGSTVFSCGADKAVRMWRLGETPPNNVAQQIGVHDAPVQSVGFLGASNLVVSGGWDNKLKVCNERRVTCLLAAATTGFDNFTVSLYQ
jgi:mRNA export factor